MAQLHKQYNKAVARAIKRHEKAKGRSAKMKAHWAIAKAIKKQVKRPSLNDCRKIATALIAGANYAGENAAHNYRYTWKLQTQNEEGEIHEFRISVVSDVPLGLKEQKKTVAKLLQAQAEKKQYQGFVLVKRTMMLEYINVKATGFMSKKTLDLRDQEKIERAEATSKKLLEFAEETRKKIKKRK